jgi:hypothetical protein
MRWASFNSVSETTLSLERLRHNDGLLLSPERAATGDRKQLDMSFCAININAVRAPLHDATRAIFVPSYLEIGGSNTRD